MNKTCPDCGIEKSIMEFGIDRRQPDGHNTYCRPCVNAKAAAYRERIGSKEYSRYQMEYRKSTPEREERWVRSRRNTSFKTKYGITLDEWERMKVAQLGKCAICVERFTSDKETHVDHDHATGQVRQLICHNCNLLLGYARESSFVLSQAISYLRRHSRKVG